MAWNLSKEGDCTQEHNFMMPCGRVIKHYELLSPLTCPRLAASPATSWKTGGSFFNLNLDHHVYKQTNKTAL